jgi:hypothetical protein
MDKYHPVIAVIIGTITASALDAVLLNISSSDALIILIYILGGFTATYLSRTNKAILGFYEGIIISIGTLLGIFIFKTEFTFHIILILILLIPITGLIGGCIAKTLRIQLNNTVK